MMVHPEPSTSFPRWVTFGPADIEAMDRAMRAALEILRRDTSGFKEKLAGMHVEEEVAKRIISAAKAGLSDPRDLTSEALRMLGYRIDRSIVAVPDPAASQ